MLYIFCFTASYVMLHIFCTSLFYFICSQCMHHVLLHCVVSWLNTQKNLLKRMQTGFVFRMEVLIRSLHIGKKSPNRSLYIYIPGLWPTKNQEMPNFIRISINVLSFFLGPWRPQVPSLSTLIPVGNLINVIKYIF